MIDNGGDGFPSPVSVVPTRVPLPLDDPPMLEKKSNGVFHSPPEIEDPADDCITEFDAKDGQAFHQFSEVLLATVKLQLKRHKHDLLDSVQKCVSSFDEQGSLKMPDMKKRTLIHERVLSGSLNKQQERALSGSLNKRTSQPATQQPTITGNRPSAGNVLGQEQPTLASKRPSSGIVLGQEQPTLASVSKRPSSGIVLGQEQPTSTGKRTSFEIVLGKEPDSPPTPPRKRPTELTMDHVDSELPGAVGEGIPQTHSWQEENFLQPQLSVRSSTSKKRPSKMHRQSTSAFLSLNDKPTLEKADGGYATNLLKKKTISAEFSDSTPKLAARVKNTFFSVTYPAKASESQQKLMRLLQHRNYRLIGALAMVLDVFMLYLDVDRVAKSILRDPAAAIDGVRDDLLFMCFFDVIAALYVIDLILRLFAERLYFFRETPLFAMFVVFCTLAFAVSAVTQHIQIHLRAFSHFRNVITQLAMFRIFRLFNVFTFIDNLHGLYELRIIIHGISGTLMPLIWSTLMIVSVLISMSLIFTEGASYFLATAESVDMSAAAELRRNYGDVYTSALTLFKSMSGGDDWGAIYDTMYPMNRFYRGLYLGFLIFSIFGLLNIVTAVFVDTAMARSRNDRQLQIDQEMAGKRQFLQSMQRIFNELDVDGDDAVELSELTERMKDPRVGAYFSSLGVDVDEVQKLFKLLDADASGSISSEEFMFGCLRLRGEAKSLDIAILHCELQWIKQNLDALGNNFKEFLESTHGFLSDDDSDDALSEADSTSKKSAGSHSPEQLS